MFFHCFCSEKLFTFALEKKHQIGCNPWTDKKFYALNSLFETKDKGNCTERSRRDDATASDQLGVSVSMI